MYASDYDQKYLRVAKIDPFTYAMIGIQPWRPAMDPYTKNRAMFYCPAKSNRTGYTAADDSDYVANVYVACEMPESMIAKPSEAIAFGERSDNPITCGYTVCQALTYSDTSFPYPPRGDVLLAPPASRPAQRRRQLHLPGRPREVVQAGRDNQPGEHARAGVGGVLGRGVVSGEW